MGAIESQITSLTIVYSMVISGADQRTHESSASLAFVRGIHRGPVNSPHKWPVRRKVFPFDDVIMVRPFLFHCCFIISKFTVRWNDIQREVLVYRYKYFHARKCIWTCRLVSRSSGRVNLIAVLKHWWLKSFTYPVGFYSVQPLSSARVQLMIRKYWFMSWLADWVPTRIWSNDVQGL